jgi:hypothetical protein
VIIALPFYIKTPMDEFNHLGQTKRMYKITGLIQEVNEAFP